MEKTPLVDKEQTARKIKDIVNKYYSDLDSIFVINRGVNTKIVDLSLQD